MPTSSGGATRAPWFIIAAVFALAGCAAGDPEHSSADAANAVPGDTDETTPYAGIGAHERVRFTGTQQSFAGQVLGGELVFQPGDDPGRSVIPVTRFAGRGGVSWSGVWKGAPFRLAVSEGTCSVAASGRSYPFVATLLVLGQQRSGCAWTEQRGFTAGAAAPAGVEIAANELIRAEWRKAANRDNCSPAGFAMPLGGEARPAHFSGGWAVAWDQPGMRSAFGIAGTGALPQDAANPSAHRARLSSQWPLFRELPALPRPSFAGYGVEGAEVYPADNPQGSGINSLAYVRIGGQLCDYNVWSRLGRSHLEGLLDSLRLLPQSNS